MAFAWETGSSSEHFTADLLGFSQAGFTEMDQKKLSNELQLCGGKCLVDFRGQNRHICQRPMKRERKYNKLW